MVDPYDSWIWDILSKDNARLKKQNKALKDMISKFISGEYSKKKLIQEYSSCTKV